MDRYRNRNQDDDRSQDWRSRGYRGYGDDYSMPDTPRSYGRRNDTGYGAYQWDGVKGEHYGKGPIGYQRSDERIFEEVCEALTYDSEVDASQIEVSVAHGEVTLKGQAPDRHSKRRAEQITETIRGVVDVHNQIKIDRSHTSTEKQRDQASRQQSGVRH